MSALFQKFVDQARSYGSSPPEGSYAKAWFFHRRLQYREVDGELRLFLGIGLSDGFHILEVLPNELRSVAYSEENGPIGIVELLSKPSISSQTGGKGLENYRALVTSGNNRSSFPRTTVKVYSIAEKKYIHVLRLGSPVLNMQSCPKSSVFAIHIQGEVQIYSAKEYRFLLTISCFHGSSMGPTFALGTSWLAFAGGLQSQQSKLSSSPKNGLGTSLPSFTTLSKDYKKTLSNLTKDVMSGLYSLGNLGGQKIVHYLSNGPEFESKMKSEHDHTAGNVTIYDIHAQRVLCTFRAHQTPIGHIAFDSSGSLLVTAGTSGQYLYVWKLLDTSDKEGQQFSPCSARLAYKIFRGITHAKIKDISFSPDSRMVAVSSQRGTIHIYALESELHESTLPLSRKLIETNDNVIEAENIITFTPFQKFQQYHGGGATEESQHSISAFHGFSNLSKFPALVVVTGSQQVLVHTLDAEEKKKKRSLQVNKCWHLNSVLRTQMHQPSGQRIKSNKNNRNERKSSTSQKSNYLSHVEMNTFRSNEVPFWATPQFVMQSLVSNNESRSRAVERSNPDYLFWEDYKFEDLKYRKHVSFSGLKCYAAADPGLKLTHEVVQCGLQDAMASTLISSKNAVSIETDFQPVQELHC
mmetsp:Transcript_10990/g.16426  ORF Transcript_10990/g.16426 Transcript_10990/m.16426 type:complete len:637 (+) Transcript_10990:31-1941(+)